MFLKSAKTLFYASLFSVIWVLPNTFFPFIGGKYFFFRTMVALAAGSYLLSWAFEDKGGHLHHDLKALLKKPLFIAVSVFVLVMVLAALFAYSPHAAFWSNFERGEGAFQMIHYYLFFTLGLLLLKEWRDWKIAFWLSLIAGLLMIGYGVLGYLNVLNCHPAQYPDGQPPISCAESPAAGFISAYQSTPAERIPTNIVGLFTQERFQGSLGNPAYVAPYLLFSLAYLAWLWVMGKDKREKNKKSWGSALFYAGLGLIFLTFLILSQTRGGFLGLVAGLVVALVYAGITVPKLRRWIVSVGLIGLILLGALFVMRDNPTISQLPVSRLFEINPFDQTAQTRFWTWGSAWEGIKERPLLGWGQENFSHVFDKHFDERHFIPNQGTETWFDRSHSIFFDYGVTTGLLGLLSYLVMIAVFVWPHIKNIFAFWKGSDRGSTPNIMSSIIIFIATAYFVQALILFDVLPIYINLFLVMAFSVFLIEEGHPPKAHANHHDR